MSRAAYEKLAGRHPEGHRDGGEEDGGVRARESQRDNDELLRKLEAAGHAGQRRPETTITELL